MFYIFHTPHFPYSSFSTLLIFHTPLFPHSSFSTLHIFVTPHFPHSSFSTLLIFHTPHFPHSSFSTLLIFHTPHNRIPQFEHIRHVREGPLSEKLRAIRRKMAGHIWWFSNKQGYVDQNETCLCKITLQENKISIQTELLFPMTQSSSPPVNKCRTHFTMTHVRTVAKK